MFPCYRSIYGFCKWDSKVNTIYPKNLVMVTSYVTHVTHGYVTMYKYINFYSPGFFIIQNMDMHLQSLTVTLFWEHFSSLLWPRLWATELISDPISGSFGSQIIRPHSNPSQDYSDLKYKWTVCSHQLCLENHYSLYNQQYMLFGENTATMRVSQFKILCFPGAWWVLL